MNVLQGFNDEKQQQMMIYHGILITISLTNLILNISIFNIENLWNYHLKYLNISVHRYAVILTTLLFLDFF